MFAMVAENGCRKDRMSSKI